MRLLIVSSEFPPGPGGIATHAYQLALHLARRRWEVTVLSPQDYASQEEISKFNQQQLFRVVSLSGTRCKAWQRLQTLHRWLKWWRPQALMASGVRAVWLAAWSAPLHRIPLITIGHGGEFGTPVVWARLLTRLAFASAHHVVCVSAYTAKRMRDMGIHPKNTTIIPNGADEDSFYPIARERLSAFRRRLGLDSANVLLTVGHVCERKGQDIVIRALPTVVKAVPDVHYLIVGLPTAREALADLAYTLGVGDRVTFLGAVDLATLVEAYNACDVYVMTSRHSRSGDFEGYGIAVVEAALCGKPAVVSSGSGLEEAIVPDYTGITVPENDPAATAAAIIQIFSDQDRRDEMGRNAYEHALLNQTWSRRAAAYDQILGGALS